MIMAHGIYKMKNSMKLILSIMIAGGLFIGTMCLVSNDGQADEESAEEVRIDMTDNYSYALLDGEWEVSHGNNYTEEELDVTFYSTDKKVVIRGSTYECGQGYPLSAEILLSGRGAYVQYGTFYDITIAFAEDETIDTDGRKMNRATYCWPDDKNLCCITVQSYDDSAVDIADSIISNVERDGCTSCTCFLTIMMKH